MSDPATDWNVNSEFMNHRQRHPNGNFELKMQIGDKMDLPDELQLETEAGFREFLYLAQVNSSLNRNVNPRLWTRGLQRNKDYASQFLYTSKLRSFLLFPVKQHSIKGGIFCYFITQPACYAVNIFWTCRWNFNCVKVCSRATIHSFQSIPYFSWIPLLVLLSFHFSRPFLSFWL